MRTLSRRSALAGLSASAAAGAMTVAPLSAAAQTGGLSVVATTGMIADAARVVAGPDADVSALMGPGVDPHAYRETRADVAEMLGADLVLWHGLFLEAQLEGFLTDLAARRGSAAALGEAIPEELLLPYDAVEEGGGRFDPHVWMDPRLWALVVDAAAEEIAARAPGSADAVAERRDAYRAELDALADYVDTVLASVPERSRVLITAHDAFRYFGRSVGLRLEGVQGVSTASEAGVRRISELVDLLVENDVPAVFAETSVSDRNMRALIEGAAARGAVVRLGPALFSDAMGAEGTYEGTYLGMIDHNATAVARALGGEAPARGRLGRLGAEL